MKIYMIRHGMTKGNQEHRYVGRTDESLLPEAAAVLKERNLPPIERLYTSPRKRCLETASILYPKNQAVVVEDFAECDFGEFEYHNYKELNGNKEYQRFIDSMGKSGFPGGEDRDTFQRRCMRGFYEMMAWERQHGKEEDEIALVVHGGTIMSILDACSVPHRDYYDWQVKNGEGFEAEVCWEEDKIYLKKIVTIHG